MSFGFQSKKSFLDKHAVGLGKQFEGGINPVQVMGSCEETKSRPMPAQDG